MEGLGGIEETFVSLSYRKKSSNTLDNRGHPKCYAPFTYMAKVMLKNIALTLGKLGITSISHLLENTSGS